MNKSTFFFLTVFILIFLGGCTSTFGGTVLLLNFKDIIYYVLISFILALFIGLKSENEKKAFWLWFILNLVLTPLSGFIYLLIKISKSI